jgi:uncharacterized membrane protein
MTMDGLAVARILHVLGVVIWIGGVAMVTLVVLPAAAKFRPDEEGADMFEVLEKRFAWVARCATLIVGFSGLYMLWRLDLWDRFSNLTYWWMPAMVAVWALFSLVLFVAEPLFLHRRFMEHARRDPRSAFRSARRLHWILLLFSLVTIAGAVAGSHGYALF